MLESVMIVEDEGIVALELEECLRGLRYDVIPPVATAAEALAAARDTRPDLVLMDIRLKGDMDGIEAGRQIMTTYGIPVVYVTAHSDDTTVRRARETAPFGYVLKPWEERPLQIAIDLALDKSRAAARVREERDWYLAMLHHCGAPMVACDPDGVVRFVNASAEHLLGTTRDAAVGRPLEEVVNLVSPPGASSDDGTIARRTTDAVSRVTRNLVLRGGGASTPVEVATVSVSGETGSDLGFLVVIRRATHPAGEGDALLAPLGLDEYLQVEAVKLLLGSGQEPRSFVEGQLEAYSGVMRLFGRRTHDLRQVDWRTELVRRAVRDAHEQTKAALMKRADIFDGDRILPDKLCRCLESLCRRVSLPGDPDARVSVGAVSLGVDTAIYCVLIVDEILQTQPTGSRGTVVVALDGDPSGAATLAVSLDTPPCGVPPTAGPALAALLGEVGGTIDQVADTRVAWTVTIPPVARRDPAPGTESPRNPGASGPQPAETRE